MRIMNATSEAQYIFHSLSASTNAAKVYNIQSQNCSDGKVENIGGMRHRVIAVANCTTPMSINVGTYIILRTERTCNC